MFRATIKLSGDEDDSVDYNYVKNNPGVYRPTACNLGYLVSFKTFKGLGNLEVYHAVIFVYSSDGLIEAAQESSWEKKRFIKTNYKMDITIYD